ncbi:MAG: protein kinase domain-containing protein [bacterium]
MLLASGTKLGPYEILAPLGAGGMGEVYRARDTRLGRDVAVKVLPEHLSAEPEVRARFEREAKTISSLNHPHICTLHDVGREGATDYLVMELIEGETLADRLAKGALALEQVLKLGSEIADALDRAHRAGIVHRDLKPANVMLTKSGAKLMDFGLARATGMAGAGSGTSVTIAALSQSPTMSQPLTAEGTIVGTFVYMAPEQLEGRDADARTDLWALGCVLYEMATGKRAFGGKSQASLISSIMTAEPPPISTIAPMSPPALDRLVRASLAKDPDERIQTAHDVKLQLEWIREAGSAAGVAAPVAAKRKSRERIAWALAAVSLAAAIAAVSLLAVRARPRALDPILTDILPPVGTNLDQYWSGVGLSPDGRTVAFLAADSAGWSIWVRPLGSEAARVLPDTRVVAAAPMFWSADSRAVGYFSTDRKLRKISIDGGTPSTLCDAGVGRGGTWNRDGVIVFAPAPEGPLVRVSAGGGEVTPATALDSTRHETSHRFPWFLPDGDHFLFVALPPGPKGWDTYVGSLRSKTVKHVLTAGSAAVYAEPGYLLFARESQIMAQPFDVQRLTLSGDAVAIGSAPELSDTDAEPVASPSRNGRFVVLRNESPPTQLKWLDRTGAAQEPLALPAGRWGVRRFSPDERRVAAMNGTDLWIIDLERSMPTRFAPTMSTEATIAWSPDGRQMAFVSKQSGRSEIYVGSADGGGEPELVPTTDAQFKYVNDWSPDGEFVVFHTTTASMGNDLWLLPMRGERKPAPYLQTPFHEARARVSPDGRWLAYMSNESGGTDVYVQSFPNPGKKVRVSRDGGLFPRWTRGGKELIYNRGGTLMSVPIEAGDEFRPGVPRPLVTLSTGITGLAMSADGERILVSEAAAAPHRTIRLFSDWAAALPR